jgi:hypothetical protein
MNNVFIDLGKYLTEDQIRDLAEQYDIPYSSLKAVLEVETLGRGFYEGTMIPVVRLENHVFGKETKYKYNKTHPHLSSTSFNGRFNLVGWKEFERFQQAYKLDKDAAIKATSWGLGQLMGYHYELLDFTKPLAFVKSIFDSEVSQLVMTIDFIKESKLDQFLRDENWAEFARGYNGKGYKQNQYDVKLKNAAARYK